MKITTNYERPILTSTTLHPLPATKPDTPEELASTTEPNTVTTVSDVSEKGSFINGKSVCRSVAVAYNIPAIPTFKEDTDNGFMWTTDR